MPPQPQTGVRRLQALDDEADYTPEQSIGYLVRTTFRRMAPLLRAQLAGDRVTIGMWYFLRALWKRDGLTQRELTEQVEIMQPTTVAALRSMQKRGLITVERDRSDKRRVRIFLTLEGRRLKRRLMPRVAAINHWVLEGVSAGDAAMFMRVLRQIHANAVRASERNARPRKRAVRKRDAA